MSIKVMSLVWERAPYTAGSLLVLLALADWANDEGFCWPSIPKIASKTRLERRSIQYIIRKLQKDEILAIEEGRGRKHQHQYTINVQILRLLPSLIKGEISDTENVQSATQKAQFAAEKVQPIAPDPSVSVNQPLEEPLPFFSADFLEAWSDYRQARKENRHAVTATIQRALCKKMSLWGEERSVAALIHSTGYTGLFEPNGNGNGNGHKPTASEKRVDQLRSNFEFLRSGGRSVDS